MSNVQTKTINISLPAPLLEELDRRAKLDYTSRSDKIRQVLLDNFRSKPSVDEWGEEGYKDLIDFRKIKKDGVPIEDVIAALEALERGGGR